MKISVVMTVRNGERHLADAIEGVLDQSLSDFEFLIVDDASTDSTPALLGQYARRDSRIRILTNQTKSGPYPSANKALREAAGQAVARHDADDISPKNRFALQWEALSSGVGVSLVTGWLERFGGEGEADAEIVKPQSWQPALEWNLLFSNAVGTGAHTMFPRVLSGTPILYQGRHHYAEDYELLCRLATCGRVVCPDSIVYRYRQHSGSITRKHRSEQDACVAEIRREHQRQYQSGNPSPQRIADVSRFWLREGGTPLTSSVSDILTTLGGLRIGFLDHIARRYGEADRSMLESILESQLHERIGFWLCRAARFRDFPAMRYLLRAAADGNVFRVFGSALQCGGHALKQKFS